MAEKDSVTKDVILLLSCDNIFDRYTLARYEGCQLTSKVVMTSAVGSNYT